MAPSKQWMSLVETERIDKAYVAGVKKFIDYVFRRTGQNGKIRCPCIKCCNTLLQTREVVELHLKVHGIIKSYTFWYHHGERVDEAQSESDDEQDDALVDETEDEMEDILRDLYPNLNDFGGQHENIESSDVLHEQPNAEANKFYRLLEDSRKPLYQGSKSSKLSALVKLLHIKSLGH